MKSNLSNFLALGLGILSTISFAMVQIVTKVCLNKIEGYKLFGEKLQACIPYAILGSVLGITGFILWTLALQKSEVIEIYWVTALAYIIIPTLSYFVLKEKASASLLLGYGLITLGAIITANTK